MDLPNNGAGGLGQSAAGYENGRAGGRVGVADWESVSVHSDIGGALGQDASQMHGLNSKCVMRRSTLPSSSTPTPCASWPGLHAQPPAPAWQAFALHQVHLGSGDEQQGARRRAELPQRRVSLPPCCWLLSALVPPPPPALQELHEQVMEMRNTIQQLRNELESRPTSVRYDSLMAEVRRSTTPATASNITAHHSLAPNKNPPCRVSNSARSFTSACASSCPRSKASRRRRRRGRGTRTARACSSRHAPPHPSFLA